MRLGAFLLFNLCATLNARHVALDHVERGEPEALDISYNPDIAEGFEGSVDSSSLGPHSGQDHIENVIGSNRLTDESIVAFDDGLIPPYPDEPLPDCKDKKLACCEFTKGLTGSSNKCVLHGSKHYLCGDKNRYYCCDSISGGRPGVGNDCEKAKWPAPKSVPEKQEQQQQQQQQSNWWDNLRWPDFGDWWKIPIFPAWERIPGGA